MYAMTEGGWPRNDAPLVIARNEAIQGPWIATSRHVAGSSRLKAAPRNDKSRVIARNEAIHAAVVGRDGLPRPSASQ